MRVWTFGGSTTEYPWPTWADILVDHVKHQGNQGENWGLCGASNLLIQSKVMECHAKNTLTSKDWVFICFTPFFRDVWHTEEKGWHCPGRLKDNTVPHHRIKDKKFIISPEHYAMRDCAAISSIILSLKQLGVNTCFWYDHDLYKPDPMLAKSNKFNFDHVLDTYQHLITPTHASLQGIIYRKYKFDSIWEGVPSQPEVHPTPKEYLTYVNDNLVNSIPWLNNGINQKTLEFVDHWEYKIRDSDTILLNKLGWNNLLANQWK